MTADALAAEDLRAAARYVGRRLEIHERVVSTNDLARALAEAGAPEGTVVLAEEQTGGRGRLGRTWASPRGGIWMSVVLRPRVPPHETPRIGLAIAAAAARALERAAPAPVRLKWPNDLLLDGRKVGGILLEGPAEAGWAIAGIGVNANVDPSALPPEFGATTLRAHLGRDVDRAAIVRALLAEIELAYEILRGGAFPTILRWWRERAAHLGSRITVTLPGGALRGVAEGLDEEGALLLREDDGTLRRLVAGEIGGTG